MTISFFFKLKNTTVSTEQIFTRKKLFPKIMKRAKAATVVAVAVAVVIEMETLEVKLIFNIYLP